eukprot:645322-Prymnesium_polylepis.1
MRTRCFRSAEDDAARTRADVMLWPKFFSIAVRGMSFGCVTTHHSFSQSAPWDSSWHRRRMSES